MAIWKCPEIFNALLLCVLYRRFYLCSRGLRGLYLDGFQGYLRLRQGLASRIRGRSM